MKLLVSSFKTASELINASACVNELLLAGKERVALRADVYTDITALCGAGNEGLSASADNLGLNIIGMDCFLHFFASTLKLKMIHRILPD